MGSILPEELHDEIPTGFNIAGHVGASLPPPPPFFPVPRCHMVNSY